MITSNVTPPTEESLLDLDGATIHVCQDGPSDAPALLLIHGTAASARSWEPMLPFLTDSHRIVRIDLAGCGRSCGRSSAPEAGSYGAPDQARLAAATLDRLGVGHAVVVGHSSGGVMATALAEQRPDLIDGLVLIDTGPHMTAYIAREVSLRGASWNRLTDDQIRDAIRDGFAAGYQIPLSYVEQFREINFVTFAATSQAVPPYLDERSLPERLAPLGKPLLVLFGEEDSRWSPASAADYRAVPGATITMLPGIGHSPNLEDPRLTATHLLSFTSRLGQGRWKAERPTVTSCPASGIPRNEAIAHADE
ncbi:alpha/beta fold hydrolase [Microlunatus sp. Gsoil 973]|jgi:pimeloyl-ACP methyl ester carboxylesterase|uniref:alpha/beta fold hydrolase n=1 Tax=Microlunatus sp. Gsoil 973 TaxID=2672569 RepID=UPI0012B4E37E|nr:alpha/beta hydrolase [Microlunatus sp. Gsoil 973]QGN32225.1 alpha/beta fold hydrolase [Microlunatus sp. Gsoil 973]